MHQSYHHNSDATFENIHACARSYMQTKVAGATEYSFIVRHWMALIDMDIHICSNFGKGSNDCDVICVCSNNRVSSKKRVIYYSNAYWGIKNWLLAQWKISIHGWLKRKIVFQWNRMWVGNMCIFSLNKRAKNQFEETHSPSTHLEHRYFPASGCPKVNEKKIKFSPSKQKKGLACKHIEDKQTAKAIPIDESNFLSLQHWQKKPYIFMCTYISTFLAMATWYMTHFLSIWTHESDIPAS